MFLQNHFKTKKIITLGIIFVVLVSLALMAPLAVKSAVKFGAFNGYGGIVVEYYVVWGTKWLFYIQYETDGYSITPSAGVLNVNATLMKGPCTVPGSSLLGFGMGMGSSRASAGIALVLNCSPTGLVF